MPKRNPGLIRRIAELFFHANPATGPQPEDQNTTESGIVSEGLVSLYDRQFKFDVTRRATYKDVEEIDQASEEASIALDTITNNVTTSDDGVQMSFEIYARNPRIKDILEKVVTTCHLHQSIRPIVRNLIKYGDMFAEIVINEQGEVVAVKQLPPITMFRNEDLTGNLLLGEPRYDKKSGKVLNGAEECAFEQKAESTGQMLATFWPWQILHMRLNHDGFSPYGKSHLRVARITYKKLKALEESLIVGRLTRDILKLVFYVDTTGLSPDQRRRALQDFQFSVMQRMHVDGRRENPFSVMTDFFVSSGWIKLGQQVQPMQTKVDIIDPKNVGIHDITDIEYLHRKFTATLRVPRSHLGFEKDVNSKSTLCLTADTRISLLDGRELPIIDLVAEYNEGKENWVYSVDPKTLQIKPGKVTWGAQTSPMERVWKITLDNGESFRATATHPVMMKNGSYRPISKLVPGDSVMPIYRKISSKEAGEEIEGYEMVLQPSTGVWEYTHRVVKSAKGRTSVRHHKDFNKRNNNPDNLQIMTWAEHEKYHREHAREVFHQGEGLRKQREWCSSEAHRELKSTQLHDQWLIDRDILTEAVRDNQTSAVIARREKYNNTAPWIQKEKNPRWRSDANIDHLIETAKRSNSMKDLIRISGYSELLIRRVLGDAKMTYPQLKSQYMNGAWKNQSVVSETVAVVNHKIVSIEYDSEQPVYDITTNEHHNFLLTVGVVTHNTIQDVQFVRFLRDVQQIVGHGLKQLFDTVLVLQDIDPEVTDYKIGWPNLSAVDQMNAAQSEMWRAQAHAIYANPPFDAIDGRWAQQHVFNLSDEEMDEIDERVAEKQAEQAAIAAQQPQPSGGGPGATKPIPPKGTIQTVGKPPGGAAKGKKLPNPTGYKRTPSEKQTQSRYTGHSKGEDDLPPTPNPDGAKSVTTESATAALLQAIFELSDGVERDLVRIEDKVGIGHKNGNSNGHHPS
jgi:hypothetical protein